MMHAKPATDKPIVLLVPDGIGVRNYLYSDVLKGLKGRKLVLLHNLPDEIVSLVRQMHGVDFEERRLPHMVETRANDQLRRLVMFAQMHRNAIISSNPTTSANWLFWQNLKGRRKYYFKALDRLARMVAKSPARLQKLEERLFRQMLPSPQGVQATRLLQEIDPEMILCTHQRSIEAGYVMTAAKALGIKTSTVIFSWDNLPKNRINYRSDYYLVWSDYMAWELKRYYPSITDQQIFITGTPQFDNYYRHQGMWSREQFEQRMGIAPGRPAICFSGNDTGFPNDPYHLHDLLMTLQEARLPENPVVIVRPSPVDHTSRLKKVVDEFPGIAILSPPLWNKIGRDGWANYYASPEDGELLLNLVYHCACVINYGSTMGVDFAHGNKPALYINYDHPECASFNAKLGLTQEHFKTLEGLNAVVFINSREEYLPAIKAALHQPDSIAPDRLQWKKKITNDVEEAAKNVAAVILKIADL